MQALPIRPPRLYAALLFALFLGFLVSSVFGEEDSPNPVTKPAAQPVDSTDAPAKTLAERTVKLSENRMVLIAPEAWERKKPRTNIVEYEFAIPVAEGDGTPGRLTIMGAGGGVEANVARWIGQFRRAEGGAVANAADPAKSEVAGETVHWVDLAGTYADKPRGPFGPTTNREGYRMLAAIIATKESGQYFVKCYGPAKTIAGAEEGFKDFVKSLKVKVAPATAAP